MRAFLAGIAATLLVGLLAVVVVVNFGLVPAGADVKPPGLEKLAAKRGLRATLARESPAYVDPLPHTDANLLAGVAVYGNNCAVCHGASDEKASPLAKGFYIEAPLLAKHGVEDDPEAETYWKLTHGIRFTAMPAFGTTLSSDDLWKLAQFLKTMDHLPPAVDVAWKKLPSAAATMRP